jgi:hypothetical protein
MSSQSHHAMTSVARDPLMDASTQRCLRVDHMQAPHAGAAFFGQGESQKATSSLELWHGRHALAQLMRIEGLLLFKRNRRCLHDDIKAKIMRKIYHGS